MIPATDFESVPGDDGITSSDDALEEGAEAGGPAITRTFGINRSESSSFGLWVAVFIFVLVVALIYTPVIYLFFRSPAQVVIILWLSVIVPLVCIPLFGFIPSSVEANRWCKCALLGMVGGLLSVLFFVAATVGLFIAILWVFTELNINETTSWIAVFLALPWLSTLTCGVLQVVVMGWVIEGLIRPHKDGSIDSRWKLYNRLSGASYGTAVGYGFSFGYFFLLPVINIAVALISENSYQTPLSYVRSFHFLSTMSSPVYNSCWMFLTSLIGAYLGWKFGLLAYPGQRPSSSIQSATKSWKLVVIPCLAIFCFLSVILLQWVVAILVGLPTIIGVWVVICLLTLLFLSYLRWTKSEVTHPDQGVGCEMIQYES